MAGSYRHIANKDNKFIGKPHIQDNTNGSFFALVDAEYFNRKLPSDMLSLSIHSSDWDIELSNVAHSEDQPPMYIRNQKEIWEMLFSMHFAIGLAADEFVEKK
jgi:hypothetical protein